MIEAAKNVEHAVHIDVRAQQIAGVYAKAFLGAAETSGATGDRVAEIEALVSEVFEKFPQFETLLSASLIKHEEKLGILDRVLGGKVSPLLLDFLKVLSQHGRLDVLRAIAREARSQYDALRGKVRVRVTTASELPPAESQKLIPALSQLLSGEPEVQWAVDPELIGGVVLRIGDTVYDGSVARQLEKMREQMITRSVHEIQSRRDSFRLADGN